MGERATRVNDEYAGQPSSGDLTAMDMSGALKLATALEEQGLGYVLAVACTHRVPTAGGPIRADHLVRGLPTRAWQVLSAGAGSKGPRLYSRAVVPIPAEQPGQCT